MDDLLRQLARERVVVMLDRVRHNEILPVRAEGAPLGEKRRKAPVVPGIVGRAGVHHAETEPAHLMGKQTEPVPAAVLRAVALAPDGAAERVNRVAHHAEKALVVHLAHLAGIERCEFAVERILRHAHIARLDGRVRHEARRAEEEHVAVKQLLRPHDLNARQRVVVAGEVDLVQLKLPPLRNTLAQIADTDRRNHIAPQQPQPHEERAPHVAERQQVHAVLLRAAQRREQLLPARMRPVHGAHAPRRDGVCQLRRHVRLLPGAERLHALLRREKCRVRDRERVAPDHERPLEEIEHLPLLRQRREVPVRQLFATAERIAPVFIVQHFSHLPFSVWISCV